MSIAKVHITLTQVGVFCLILLLSSTAHGGFEILEGRGQVVLDPFIEYQFKIDLVGGPGTLVQGSTDPSERDFFTVIDVPDLIDDVFKPLGWTSTIQNVGIDPFPPLDPPFFDDPNIPNITFSFFPNDIIEVGDQGRIPIGTFSIQTADVPVLNPLSELTILWQTSKKLSDGTIVKESGIDSTRVMFIPEPSTLVASLIGFSGLLVLGSIRSRWFDGREATRSAYAA